MAGAKDEDEGIEIAKKFSLKDVAKNITCPFLVTHGGNDRVITVENTQKLYDAVGSTNKTLKIFSTEEGGAEHAHVDNRQIGIDFAADWLHDNIGSNVSMPDPIQIRMGGYGPADDRLQPFAQAHRRRAGEAQFGDRIAVKYVWNIMDFGYKAEDILWLVEDGMLTLGYQSWSYLTDRVPELELVDLPFCSAATRQARGAMEARSAGGSPRPREARRLPHPWMVRERLPAGLEPRPTVRTPADLKGIPSACCRARSRSGPSSSWAPSR